MALLEVKLETGRTHQIRRLPDQPGDVPMTFASVDRARKLLGFEPQTPLATGLHHFVQWLQEAHPLA